MPPDQRPWPRSWLPAIGLPAIGLPAIGLLAIGLLGAPLAYAQAPDPHWPHVYEGPEGGITVYEPQVISWPDHATLTARAAVAVTQKGSDKPILGTVEVSLATHTDDATRIVTLSDPKLVSSRFASLDTQQAAAMEARLRQALPEMQTKAIPLDTVLLGLKQASAQQEVKLNNDPPVIFHSEKPASLLLFDGPPVLVPIPNSPLKLAVNANWNVVVDGADGAWYLLNDGAWYKAADHAGPYQPVATVPAAFSALPKQASFADIARNVPGRPKPADLTPVMFVSDKPAELIVTIGAPVFMAIAGTSLQRAANSNATLIRDADGTLYFLSAGRWFAAPGLDGPWHFATPDLPPDFALLPPGGPTAAAVVAVPGTAEAQQAVLRAQVPQQATIRREAVKFTAMYAGKPEFRPIGGTGVSYATNTAQAILEVGGKYYACQNAVWFVASSPTGPWVAADAVPPAIYSIPPSSPAFPVTAVKIYTVTPATITYGYTAGYMLGFVSAGALVYGTGYYYPPVVVPGPMPVYYPYPATYAGGVAYNPATGVWARGGTAYHASTGAWARGGAVYGPYGGAGAFTASNPATGAHAQGSAHWNSGYGTGYASFANPATGRSGSTTQNANPYGRWGSSVVSGPNQTVHTESGRNANGTAGGFRSSTGAQGAAVHGVGGNNAAAVRGAGGDVYAGVDGNVYRHDANGWQSWNNGGWQTVQRNTAQATHGNQYGQLNQDRAARLGGAQAGGAQVGGIQRGGGQRNGGRFR